MSPTVEAMEAVLPRKEPVQERSRKRFERILWEATKLIEARGVDAVAMKEIAQASEISIASLYQYFPDKAAIIATLADRFFREGQTCIQALFGTVSTRAALIEALHGMVDSYYDCFLEMPGAYGIWQATQSDRRLQRLDEEDCAEHVRTLESAMLRVAPDLAAVRATELTPMAKLLVGVIAGAVRSAITLPDEEARALLEMCKHRMVRPAIAATLPADDEGVFP